MNTPQNHIDTCDFSQHWMAWLALRHFLSARLLRALATTVVSQASNGRYSIDELFEEALSGDEPWEECWIIRPRKFPQNDSTASLREYFVRLIHSLVAQTDVGGSPARLRNTTAPGSLSPDLLDVVFRFGSADIEWDADAWEPYFAPPAKLQGSFRVLFEAFKMIQKDHRDSREDSWSALDALINPVEMPLRAMLFKHLADLYADTDAWENALPGYRRAETLLEAWQPEVGWEAVRSAWKTSILGSLASTLSIIQESSESLVGTLDETSLEQDPLRVINLLMAPANPDEFPQKERWFSIASAPLLQSPFRATPAVDLWLRGKYDAAQERFWAVLRRQISMGAGVGCRSTKLLYARSIIESLTLKVKGERSAEMFLSAARMLVESGNINAVERISWPSSLIRTYVDQACINMLIDHAGRHNGSKIERERVVIYLFKTWGSDHRGLVQSDLLLLMWRHVATRAHDFLAVPEQTLSLGQRCSNALQDLANSRPEWRASVAQDVQQMICQQLSMPLHLTHGDACKTASAYAEAFTQDALGEVIRAVVNMLQSVDDGASPWSLLRLAFAFLVSDAVTAYSRVDSAMGKEIVRQLLRLGLSAESERRSLLFNLQGFDPELFNDTDIRTTLHDSGIIRELLSQAKQYQSSVSMQAIMALLVAPSVSGREGVEGAIESLRYTLASASDQFPSLGLAMAYRPLLRLLDSRQEIEQVLPNGEGSLCVILGEFLSLTLSVWQQVSLRPELFSAFAVAASMHPDPAVVHNWAVASSRLAEAVGDNQQIVTALGEASKKTELAAPIALAWATRGVTRPVEKTDLENAGTLDPDIFYETIGRRLTQVHGRGGEAVELCKVLVAQCLRFGPRDIDAAVFMEAAHLNLHGYVRACGLNDYARRLAAHRDRRLMISPILDLFSRPSEGAY